jgi:ABC-2 type transport system permease protein
MVTTASWLRVVTANQPITEAIDTLRAVLAGQSPGSHPWLALAELGEVVVVALALARLSHKLALRREAGLRRR